MAGGNWNEADQPIRAGFYMRLRAAALAAIQPGARGIVTIPVKANWGPVKKIVSIASEKELIATFGMSQDDAITAYKCIRMVLLGGPKQILAYRISDGSHQKASLKLKNSANQDVVNLITKFETDRPFKVTILDNIVDSTKQDLILYEGSTLLTRFTFVKNDLANFVQVVNEHKENLWIDASLINSATGALAVVTSQDFAGGNNGTTATTIENYIEAMAAFEARFFNAFVLDGVTDSPLITSVASWIRRLRGNGRPALAFVGGSTAGATDHTIGDGRSKSINYEGVVNVTEMGLLDGVWYSSAEVACYVAGLASGQALSESLTYASTPFIDVKPQRTHEQVVEGIQAGSLMLTFDIDGKVVIEKGINTLSSLRSGQNNAWKKIKTIRIMDAIESDTSSAAHRNYIGKVSNNGDGQAAITSAIKNYFEMISPTLVDSDFIVGIDQDLQPTADGDQFFWFYDARVIDNIERIYGTGNVRY